MAQDQETKASADMCILDFCVSYADITLTKERVILMDEIGAKVLVESSTFEKTWKSDRPIIYNWEKSQAYFYKIDVPDQTLNNIVASLSSLRISLNNLTFDHLTISN